MRRSPARADVVGRLRAALAVSAIRRRLPSRKTIAEARDGVIGATFGFLILLVLLWAGGAW